MTRKCHYHRLQTNPWHREEETHNTDSHKQVKKLSVSANSVDTDEMPHLVAFHRGLHCYTPPLKCGEVLCYTLRCLSVCPSVRPCSPFPIDNLIIYSRNFFKFCIHIVIGDEWYGIVNGKNPSIFNGVTALFRIGKMVSGLLFLYCS